MKDTKKEYAEYLKSCTYRRPNKLIKAPNKWHQDYFIFSNGLVTLLRFIIGCGAGMNWFHNVFVIQMTCTCGMVMVFEDKYFSPHFLVTASSQCDNAILGVVQSLIWTVKFCFWHYFPNIWSGAHWRIWFHETQIESHTTNNKIYTGPCTLGSMRLTLIFLFTLHFLSHK